MDENEQFCGKTKFITLCKVCEDISSAKTRDTKINIMRKFIDVYRNQSKGYKEDTFYPILRLLLPQLDHERGPYGIKETTLANMYIRVLCLSKNGNDAQKFLSYRAPKVAGCGVGDFADVAYFVLRPRSSEGGTMTVHKVNQCLNNISMKHASHDPRGVDDELQIMVLKMSALEQKWLIRILLKDMKLGLSQNKIFNSFHLDATDLYDVCNDLQKICSTLKDPSIRLHEIEVGLFKPFRPMLSKRCDIQSIEKDLPKLDYYFVETKYDGERFQLHYKEGEFKYFSRNGYDYTDTYGCNTSNGILTPLLAKQFHPNVTSYILDGEMMCWNSRLKCFSTKGGNIDVKSLRVGCVHQACFCVFDILLLDGVVLTNKPLVERIKILDSILTSSEGIVMNTIREKVKDRRAVLKNLNRAIDDLEEGIIVKEPNSIYKPNSRSAGWYKIKPEYTAGVMVELDVLIIGGYYGAGRRRGIISQFLVALAVPLNKPGDEDAKIFQSFSRVGSGCTKEELEELHKKVQNHWKRSKPNQMPPGIEWTKEKPDLWIEPQNSYILQVKATEVTRSDAFKVGYTLRFPRIEHVRYDKPWRDCLTVQEFEIIRQATDGKLRGNYATEKSDPSPSKKEKKCKQPLTICEEFKPANLGHVKKLYNFLDNQEICVLTGHPDISKGEIERKIVECGGTVCQNPGENTYIVLAHNENNIRTRNVMKLKRFNVMKIDWIIKCFGTNNLVERTADDFLCAKPENTDLNLPETTTVHQTSDGKVKTKPKHTRNCTTMWKQKPDTETNNVEIKIENSDNSQEISNIESEATAMDRSLSTMSDNEDTLVLKESDKLEENLVNVNNAEDTTVLKESDKLEQNHLNTVSDEQGIWFADTQVESTSDDEQSNIDDDPVEPKSQVIVSQVQDILKSECGSPDTNLKRQSFELTDGISNKQQKLSETLSSKFTGEKCDVLDKLFFEDSPRDNLSTVNSVISERLDSPGASIENIQSKKNSRSIQGTKEQMLEDAFSWLN